MENPENREEKALVFAKKLVFFGDAGVDVAVSSYMQPTQERFHIEKEKKWGKGFSLDRASLYWYLICADP